jgi:hypothetical protein
LQVYISILKFDVFLFLEFMIDTVLIESNQPDGYYVLQIALMPATLLLIILSSFMVQRESVYGTIVVLGSFSLNLHLMSES